MTLSGQNLVISVIEDFERLSKFMMASIYKYLYPYLFWWITKRSYKILKNSHSKNLDTKKFKLRQK